MARHPQQLEPLTLDLDDWEDPSRWFSEEHPTRPAPAPPFTEDEVPTLKVELPASGIPR